MIYNLAQFLRTEFPTETIYINQENATDSQGYVPPRRTIVKESGGTEDAGTNLKRQSVQFLFRDVDAPKARALAYLFYNKLQSRWGLLLPQITVDSIIYPQLETAQISHVQMPFSAGVDDQGRSVYLFNSIVIWKE